MDNASILSRRDVRPLPKPARKEVSPAPGTTTGKPILNRCACLLGNFELNRPTCFLLNHRRSVSHPAADTHVIGLQPDEITTPKFAVDSKVEQREVTFSPLQLEPDPYGPDISRLQRTFLADEAPLVPGIVLPTRRRVGPSRPCWRAHLAVKSRKTPCRQASGTADLVP